LPVVVARKINRKPARQAREEEGGGGGGGGSQTAAKKMFVYQTQADGKRTASE
jgi:hypothetical protein